jgi:DNA-binding transcriptional LysR family regulator
MISFDGIVEFVTVAESNGFSAAARHLGINVSQVSRKIAALERELGIALFVRSTRKVRLTEAGIRYYNQCKELVVGLEEANEDLAGDKIELSGTLKVSASGEFAELYIAPLLMAFTQQHPKLSVDINFNSNMINFTQDQIDFSIRYGNLSDSSLIARKLTDRSLIAAASPDYLAEFGMPTHPSDLSHHSCLITNNNTWFFQENGKTCDVKVRGRWRANSGRSIVSAASKGLGIAYLPSSSFGSALADGTLVPILKPFWTSNIATWIVYANRNFMPARSRLAIEFLLKQFEGWREGS